jgi:hypothetical protein
MPHTLDLDSPTLSAMTVRLSPAAARPMIWSRMGWGVAMLVGDHESGGR